MASILLGNIKGPQGDTGPQGPQGEIGPEGPQGPLPPLVNNALATEAGVGALDAAMGPTFQNQIDTLNSNLDNVNSKLENVNSNLDNVNSKLENVNSNLSKVINRRIIFVGDSYSTGYVVGQTENNSNWMDNAILFLNDSTISFYKCQKGGTAFGDSRQEYTFLQQLKDWESAVTDKSSITDIIVCGGRNDMQFTLTQIISGIIAFISYCKTTYPNAMVQIGMIGGYVDGGSVTPARKVVEAYAYASQHGGCFINNLQYSLRDSAYMSSDSIHPSEFGQQALGKNIANYIKNKNVTVALHLERSSGYFVTGLTPYSGNALFLEQCLINEFAYITNTALAIYDLSSGMTVSCGGSEIELGSINRTLIIGSTDSAVGVYAPVVLYTSGGNYYTVNCNILIKDNRLVIKAISAEGTTGFNAYGNVTRFYIPPFTIVNTV